MQFPIPKHIHVLWLGDRLPRWLKNNLARMSEVNPGWAVTLWRDAQLVDMVPSALRRTYDKCQSARKRSNILRLGVLRQLGGWYLDADMWAVRPLQEFYDENPKCNLGFGGSTANGAFCAHPEWPAWDDLIHRLKLIDPNDEDMAWRKQYNYLTTNEHVHGCVRPRQFMLEGLYDSNENERAAYDHFLRHGCLRQQDRFFVVHPVRFVVDAG